MADEKKDESNVDNRKWHLGKVIDAPLLIAVALQTAGFVWAGAQIAKTVELQGIQIAAIDLKVNSLIQAQGASLETNRRLQTAEQEISALRVKSERLELELVRSTSNQGRGSR